MDYIIVKKAVSVSKKEYIKHWEEKIRRLKIDLKYYKVETTKNINKKTKWIAKLEKEINELK